MLHIVDLYLHPPTDGLLFSLDEKTGIQALERKYPDQQSEPGQPYRREHSYHRHGTQDLLAAFEVSSGNVFAQTLDGHSSVHWEGFIKELVSQYPESQKFHFIQDNYSTHSTPGLCQLIAQLCAIPLPELRTQEDRRRWLMQNDKRIIFHSLPTHASWLNQSDALRKGDTLLIGNKGYRRFLSVEGKGHFVVDEKKGQNDARFDGKWVLTTDLALPMVQVALKYKQLILVEMIFRDMKSVLDTRPIFHKCDETIRGHVFCSFLALVLRKELDRILENAGHRFEWEDIKRDLKALTDTTITDDNKTISVRSRAEGCCGKVFAAVGVALPATIKSS